MIPVMGMIADWYVIRKQLIVGLCLVQISENILLSLILHHKFTIVFVI